MFMLYTPVDIPIWFGLRTRRIYRLLGTFHTYNDACGYAFNVCGFNTSHDFRIHFEKEE